MNKKVRNATPLTFDNIKFKSKLEVYCYQKLKENNIKAFYEGQKFVLLDSFEFNGEKVRKMTYTPDFVGDGFVIECKGMANDAFPLRWKLFKYNLHKQAKARKILGLRQIDIYLLRNKKHIEEAIISIKEKFNDKREAIL